MSPEQNPDWLKRWRLYSPDNIAITDTLDGRHYSYKDFYEISCRMAQSLQNQGVGVGDRVAVLAHNRVETVFLFFALQRLGAILVPINFRLTSKEVDFVLQDSKSGWLFFEEPFTDLVDSLESSSKRLSFDFLRQAKEDESGFLFEDFMGLFDSPCKILYTSGTTGFPKGVVITSKILFWNSVNTSMSLNITSEDVTINFSPLFHTGGWNVLMTPFFHRGARVVFQPKFDADETLRWMEKEKVSIFFGVPTTLAMMSRSDVFAETDLSSVRYTIVGGEPMPLNMIRTWHERGVSVRQGFGMTECGPNCFSLSEKDAETKIGSIGRPNFYVETQVVDENYRTVGVGEVGELWLRGPMCMTQYWQNDEATRDAFSQGWLKTGDLVRFDEDQYFYVVGRKKEMYISGGENVYPAEVEKVLSSHPEVEEVAVLGVDDPKWGEVGKAFLVTRSLKPLDQEDIVEFCQQQLARYKIPKKFEFMESLPKGDSGKILKKQLMQSI